MLFVLSLALLGIWFMAMAYNVTLGGLIYLLVVASVVSLIAAFLYHEDGMRPRRQVTP